MGDEGDEEGWGDVGESCCDGTAKVSERWMWLGEMKLGFGLMMIELFKAAAWIGPCTAFSIPKSSITFPNTIMDSATLPQAFDDQLICWIHSHSAVGHLWRFIIDPIYMQLITI